MLLTVVVRDDLIAKLDEMVLAAKLEAARAVPKVPERPLTNYEYGLALQRSKNDPKKFDEERRRIIGLPQKVARSRGRPRPAASRRSVVEAALEMYFAAEKV